jgi:hypothetical protein
MRSDGSGKTSSSRSPSWHGTAFDCTTQGKAEGLPGDAYFTVSDWTDNTLFVTNESKVFISRDSGGQLEGRVRRPPGAGPLRRPSLRGR